MTKSIENYQPQIAVGKIQRQAFFVWSVFVLIAFVWVFLTLLAPVAAANDLTAVSNPLYKFFSFVCHQIPARSFHLENHPFAVCSRCFGIYAGLLAGIVAYPIFRLIETVEPLPRVWLFLAMIPVGVDWSLGFFGVWENTDWSRFLTGAILGVACAVYILPALIEIRRLFSMKRRAKWL